MSASVTRRTLLAGTGVLAAGAVTGVAAARILPRDMVPLVGPGYRPTDKDEVGIWQRMERVEEEIAGSNLLIKDDRLNAYLRDLIGKVGGPATRDMRIYLARIPDFNAVMFPTGFSVVFSGLLLQDAQRGPAGRGHRPRERAFPAEAPDPPVARHPHQVRPAWRSDR